VKRSFHPFLCDPCIRQFFCFFGLWASSQQQQRVRVDFFQKEESPFERPILSLNTALSGQEQPSTSRAIVFVRSRVLLSSFTSRFLFSLSTGLKE